MKSDTKIFDWDEYYKNKSNETPRDTLVRALEFFKSEKLTNGELCAIDIGCGHGADTIPLLKQGWRVLAVDNQEKGLSILFNSVEERLRKNLQTKKMSFEEIILAECDLLNASYCIPFCGPDKFSELWMKISDSIKKGGRFSGQFFGVNDSWAGNPNMTFHKKEDVQELFREFNIEYFEEKDEDGTTASGESKHWHVFSVVAKKLN